MTNHQKCCTYQKFDVTCKRIRYGIYKQSVLMLGHRVTHSYNWKSEFTIELSNMPIKGSCVFVDDKPYMVSAFSGGRETRDDGKTWSNIKLSLIEVNDISIPKFKGKGIVYGCDVQQQSKEHHCPCGLGRAIV